MSREAPVRPASAGAPRIEHHREPVGIQEASPRLSWSTDAEADWTQAAYELEARRPDGAVATVRVDSADQVLVPWPFDPLSSRQRTDVRVRVLGRDGGWGPWSGTTTVEAGLLVTEDWSARPVAAEELPSRSLDERRPPLMRRAFHLDAAPASARLYVTAHGLFQVEVNGTRVGRDELTPGWTSYDTRLRYATYDVTSLLRAGENVVGAWLGDGWYRGRLGFHGGVHDLYGNDLSLLAQLDVEDGAGGSRTAVATDASWRTAPGPVLRSGLLDGEVHDAREERPGWSSPGFDAHDWAPVVVGTRDPVTLVAGQSPPVRVTGELVVREVLTTPSGATVLDFGQNFSGRVRLRTHGAAGTTVRIRTGEVLQGGELFTRNLRDARSEDAYVLRGSTADDPEEWEPRFTVHGFRYAQVDGWPGDVEEAARRGDLVGRVLHTDLERTGWFTCSDPALERLHENVVWSTRSNFVSIPTDCPQRDERLGWTGDIQVFAPTASFLFDVSGMLGDWLRDLWEEQQRFGTVPWFVPFVPCGDEWDPSSPGAVWGDVATLLPLTLHERFGDTGVLEAQLASATAWVAQVDALAGDDGVWDSGTQLGDWLDPTAPPDDPMRAVTDPYLVSTAYFARSAQALAAIHAALGQDEEAARCREVAGRARDGFRRRFTADGVPTDRTQTAFALGICFELLEDPLLAGDQLARLVEENGHRIGTGFAGVNLITDALSRTGHTDVAYRLLTETEGPSWLSMVERGATTIWERWDSMLADGTVNSGEMTSFNHYALGSVADWMHRVVAGLAPTSPGYRTVRFAPRPGGGLTRAAARHRSPYGEVAVSWELDGARLVVEVELPIGTRGTVDLPGQEPVDVGPGRHRFPD